MGEVTAEMIPFLKKGIMVLGKDSHTGSPPTIVAVTPKIYSDYPFDHYWTIPPEAVQEVGLDVVKEYKFATFALVDENRYMHVFYGYTLLDPRMDIGDKKIMTLFEMEKKGND